MLQVVASLCAPVGQRARRVTRTLVLVAQSARRTGLLALDLEHKLSRVPLLLLIHLTCNACYWCGFFFFYGTTLGAI